MLNQASFFFTYVMCTAGNLLAMFAIHPCISFPQSQHHIRIDQYSHSMYRIWLLKIPKLFKSSKIKKMKRRRNNAYRNSYWHRRRGLQWALF